MNSDGLTKVSLTATQVLAQSRPVVAAGDTAQVAQVATPDRNEARSESVAAAVRESKESVAERLQALSDKLNVSTASISRKLRFQFVEDANISVIQVYDRETEKLIRQIPSEEAVARLEQGAAGFVQLIDTFA